MSRYAVRLRIVCPDPPNPQQLARLRGGRWEITANRRGAVVSVRMLMQAGDPAGALARCMNVVLEGLPGEVVHAATDRLEDAVAAPRVRTARRRPRGRH